MVTFFVLEVPDYESAMLLYLYTWVVLQKLSQLSDRHFSQVQNKLENIFFLVL